jgi:hypothetical protein
MQRLQKGNQKTTPFYYYVGSYQNINGVNKRVFTIDKIGNNPVVRFCNFSTYGGTEYQNNGIYSVDDTANVVTWYDPAITAGGAIQLCNEGMNAPLFEILGEPENIEMRNQELQFKVRRFKGGA